MPRPGTGWFVASSPSSRRQMLEVASLNNLLLEEDLLPAALRLRPPPPLSSLESPCQGRRRRRRQRRRKNVEEAWGGQNSWLNISMEYGRRPWLQSQCDPIWWSRWKEVLIVLCINLCPPPSCPCSVQLQAHPRGAHLPRQRRRRRKPKKEPRSLPRRKVSPPQWRLTRRKRRS